MTPKSAILIIHAHYWPPFFGLWLIATGASLGGVLSYAFIARVTKARGDWLMLAGFSVIAIPLIAYGFVPQ